MSRILVVFLVVLTTSCLALGQAPPNRPVQANIGERDDLLVLEMGASVERELGGGQSYSYAIALAADEYLHVVVQQKGIDVVVSLFGPDGQKAAEIDSPNGNEGPEPLSYVAQQAGSYRVEVRSPEAEAAGGLYEVKVEELRASTAEDRARIVARIAAEAAFVEAEQLMKTGTADARRQAIEKYTEARRLFQTAGDQGGEAFALSNLGAVYNSLGKRDEAFASLNQALALHRAVGNRKMEALMLSNIGAVCDLWGKQREGLDFLNQALPLFRKMGDRYGEALALKNIGRIYNSLGEPQKALDFLNQALVMLRAVGSVPGENSTIEEASTLHRIGSVYVSLGELQTALDFFSQALPLRRAAGDRNGEATTLASVGQAYSLLGEPQKALDFLSRALPMFRTLGDRRSEATTLTNIGAAYASLGEAQKGLDFHNQSLLLAREVGDRKGEAIALRRIGKVYASLGKQDEGLNSLNMALTLFRTVGNRLEEAITLTTIGDVYNSLSKPHEALDYLDQALALHRAVGNREMESDTLAATALAERDTGNLPAALAHCETALSIVEDIRTSIAGPDMRASYFATVHGLFDLYINVLMRQHREHPADGYDATALQASERARARTLLELLHEAGTDIRQGVDPELLERERTLQQMLAREADRQVRLLGGRHTDDQAVAIKKELDELTSQYQDVEARIRATSPRYAALTQPQPLSLSQIQREVLDRDTLLLEYALGKKRSYLWAVSSNAITSYELPKRTDVDAAVLRLNTLMTARQQPVQGESFEQRGVRIAAADAEYPKAAADLSRMLLEPVAALLGRKRLVIVADGALQYVPFAALPAPVPPGGSPTPGGGGALIVEHEVVNLPSASALAVLRRETDGRAPAPKAVAVLADPVFKKDDGRVQPSVVLTKVVTDSTVPAGAPPVADTGTGSSTAAERPSLEIESALTRATRDVGADGFARLPFSRQEAKAILAAVPGGEGFEALDFAASRATATSPTLGQYRILHFATHGLLDSEHPELSGVVLSLVDQQGQPEDGFLRLHEIYNLKLPADLVVLSACQTALGDDVRGEGLVGLTRGFMYAGARRVVASLWKVDDDATAELMKRFYEGMLGPERKRPAEALRAAQVAISKKARWRAPYYWAGFVLQGEWRADGPSADPHSEHSGG